MAVEVAKRLLGEPGTLAMSILTFVSMAGALNSSILWDGGTGTSIGFANPGNTNGFLGEAEFSIVDSAAVDGLSSDPMFKDADVGDHRLVVGSPGIDSGDPALGLDPDGSAPDMGSHIYLGR